ncbi:malonate decarboxylase holo-[acyl-carrier-protein] synthase [Denitromonas iodatirespirans]|uniref:Malonate decarboxylase holo-[acyl-carrier-protein] synthase n=1 Tax=Denitromonas iodatirespirans TaxID=2795389 RepID=A0A944DCB7_DENI1|nr:malonate decarboxylase holo-[acyl-carrier-protein] synthase [Denitromonas iodatirespirans]MBT0961873.1 malonate decarboxylase holo-[acyl-carrier-protein] synthase [Denitromonas iodatirespirans]
MAETLPRRHDRVWLDPAAIDRLVVSQPWRAALVDWLGHDRPLVAARRMPGQALLPLGFTLPGTGARVRVGVLAPVEAIRAQAPAPPLTELLSTAPASWQAPLAALAEALAAAGVTARSYGSLVNQWLTGAPCLRADSDVDLLLDCADADSARQVLAVLAGQAPVTPRIDGELRLHGRAVAWRELAAALASGGRVLAKSDTTIALMPAQAVLQAPAEPGGGDAPRAQPLAA